MGEGCLESGIPCGVMALSAQVRRIESGRSSRIEIYMGLFYRTFEKPKAHTEDDRNTMGLAGGGSQSVDIWK